MRFSPKSREELETIGLMKPGIYQFSVANAIDKTSKGGNEMIALTLEVFDEMGATRNVFDYLLEAMPQKLFGFCEATSMEHHYHQGTLRASDCIGKSAFVELTIQKGKDNPQGGTYSDKNEVKKYTAKKVATAENVNPLKSNQHKSSQQPPFADDDVPF